MESSKSVAWRIILSPAASMRIPDKTGSVDRVETPLRTMDRALASSVPIDTEFQGMPLFVRPELKQKISCGYYNAGKQGNREAEQSCLSNG